MKENKDLQIKAINTIRFLSADAVQKANSGHPGLPMGDAAIGYTIWARHIKINPKNPDWPDRDRFVLSGGHGSMLLYSLLHLTGFDLSLEEIKNFRQWDSITPGHPEYGLTPGVETTTGPLGQGFGNGVGMAIAEANLAARFNKPGHTIVDHYVYAIVTDGDLMEGVASEAASLAGHLRLGKLIYFYDDNHITIDGTTELTFTEDSTRRFESYGWHIQKIENGNDVDAIDEAIIKAKDDDRPSLIFCRTKIGYGLPTKQGTKEAHGEPPGVEELKKAKEDLGWPQDKEFLVPDDVKAIFRGVQSRGREQENAWLTSFESYAIKYPDLADEFKRRASKELTPNWDVELKHFDPDPKGMATRKSSGIILNQIAERLPELIGGSADLAPSNKTWIDSSDAFQKDNYSGRNFHFGVREHAMGAIINGIAYHGGFIPYGGTFLVFSDYMRPAVRLSALSHIHTVWVYTHDSIGLGEDGPTHQPVEHLMSLRTMPGLLTIRPADANEVREAWIAAVQRKEGPTVLIFTRQNVPTYDRNKYASAEGLHKGAYVLTDLGGGKPDIIMMASGSEVQLILEAGEKLLSDGIRARIVSFPSWELFGEQPESYKNEIIDPGVKKRLAVEAGVCLGWERWVGDNGSIIGIDKYGSSAPGPKILHEYGFNVENVYLKAKLLLK